MPRETSSLTKSTVIALGMIWGCILGEFIQRVNAEPTIGMPEDSPSAVSARPSSAAVYWVGHSLVEGKASTSSGEIDLMRLVGRFAGEKGLAYDLGDHTLWGSPISALWRGRPHGYDRDASQMVKRREVLKLGSGRFDHLIITEALPVDRALKSEFSAYYLRQFACTLLSANPNARILLYQTWVNYQGGDPNGRYGDLQHFDWRKAMMAQRRSWEQLADEASKPSVRTPGGILSYIGIASSSDGGCNRDIPIQIVPVGDAFLKLDARIAAPRTNDAFETIDGQPITTGDLFANPFIDWPKNWPLSQGVKVSDLSERLARLTLRDPARKQDDIHVAELGIHLSALVHFASIYRQPPVGLSHPDWITAATARSLECIAWETVTQDARTGVTGAKIC